MHQLFITQLLSPNASYNVIKHLKHKEGANAPGLACNQIPRNGNASIVYHTTPIT